MAGTPLAAPVGRIDLAAITGVQGRCTCRPAWKNHERAMRQARRARDWERPACAVCRSQRPSRHSFSIAIRPPSASVAMGIGDYASASNRCAVAGVWDEPCYSARHTRRQCDFATPGRLYWPQEFAGVLDGDSARCRLAVSACSSANCGRWPHATNLNGSVFGIDPSWTASLLVALRFAKSVRRCVDGGTAVLRIEGNGRGSHLQDPRTIDLNCARVFLVDPRLLRAVTVVKVYPQLPLPSRNWNGLCANLDC